MLFKPIFSKLQVCVLLIIPSDCQLLTPLYLCVVRELHAHKGKVLVKYVIKSEYINCFIHLRD